MAITTRQVGKSGIAAASISGLVNADPFESRTFYVQSTHIRASNFANSGLKATHPLATIAKAVTMANANDMIIVGPTHTETLIAAVTWALNDLKIIGIGEGDRRPQILFGTDTAAEIDLTGEGCLIENIHFEPAVDSLVNMLLITGPDNRINGCHFAEGSSIQALSSLTTVATADRLIIENCTSYQPTAGAVNCIELVGGDRIIIRDCWLAGDYSVAVLHNGGAAMVRCLITRNHLDSLNAAEPCIEFASTTDGEISENKCRLTTDATQNWIVAADCQWYENYGVNLDGETGVLIGTASV